MNEEITASEAFDESTFLEGFRWHCRVHRWARMMQVFALYALIGVLLVWYCMRGYVFETDQVLVLISVPLLFAWSRNFLEARIIVSTLRSSPIYGQPVNYRFDSVGVQITTDKMSQQIRWDGFYKIVTSKGGALLYQQIRLFNWISKSAFTSEADYSRFLDLLAAKTKHSKLG